MKLMATEKAVMIIELQNTLTFQLEKIKTKDEIKKDIETLLSVKIESIRTLVRGNKKYAYVKLKPEFQAIDVATKLGMM